MIDQSQLMWGDDKLLPKTGDAFVAETHGGLQYSISGSLLAEQPDLLRKHRVAITAHVLQSAGADPVALTTYNIGETISRRPRPVKEKLDMLLRELARQTSYQVGNVSFSVGEDAVDTNSLMRAAGLSGPAEMMSLLHYADSRGLVSYQPSSTNHRVRTTIPGIVYVEDLDTGLIDSTTAFIAMWFNSQMADAYNEGIVPAVEDSGFSPVRIDNREYNNKIDDEIISEIRRARFIIADFSCDESGARGGVYFEAGFGLALGKQVIFTVRKSDLEKVHFDTRQFNHIVWDQPADLRTKLVNRIGATVVVGSRRG